MVECHCVLPQYRNRKEVVYHSFVVFSIIDEAGTVIPKHATCNNCGVIHNVRDICKSEIIPGREIGAVIEIDDIKRQFNYRDSGQWGFDLGSCGMRDSSVDEVGC